MDLQEADLQRRAHAERMAVRHTIENTLSDAMRTGVCSCKCTTRRVERERCRDCGHWSRASGLDPRCDTALY